jgi:hypothetical protein
MTCGIEGQAVFEVRDAGGDGVLVVEELTPVVGIWVPVVV